MLSFCSIKELNDGRTSVVRSKSINNTIYSFTAHSTTSQIQNVDFNIQMLLHPSSKVQQYQVLSNMDCLKFGRKQILNALFIFSKTWWAFSQWLFISLSSYAANALSSRAAGLNSVPNLRQSQVQVII